MRRKKKIASVGFTTIILSCLWMFCISCATSSMHNAPPQYNLLFAEHSAMKKRLPLIERENDVLTKENDHYRIWVRELEGNIKTLSADLKATNKKYTQELADKSERIENLEIAIQKLDEEKTVQIASLNNTMAIQEKTFAAQREQLIQDNKQKESFLSIQLADKDNALKNKTLEITTLASAKADLEKALDSKAMEVSELASTKTALEKEIESKTIELSKLIADNKENLKKLNMTTEMIASLKKARDKSMAELESAKAANADLVKTFNELFNQLQLEKDRSGTKI